MVVPRPLWMVLGSTLGSPKKAPREVLAGKIQPRRPKWGSNVPRKTKSRESPAMKGHMEPRMAEMVPPEWPGGGDTPRPPIEIILLILLNGEYRKCKEKGRK